MASLPPNDLNVFPNWDYKSLPILPGVTNSQGEPFHILDKAGNCFIDHLYDLYIFSNDYKETLLYASGEEVTAKNWLMMVIDSFEPEQVDLNDFYKVFVSWLDTHDLEISGMVYKESREKVDFDTNLITELKGYTNGRGKPLRVYESFGRCHVDEHGDLYILSSMPPFILSEIDGRRLTEKNWIHEMYHHVGWDKVDLNDFIEAFLVFLEFHGYEIAEIKYTPIGELPEEDSEALPETF